MTALVVVAAGVLCGVLTLGVVLAAVLLGGRRWDVVCIEDDAVTAYGRYWRKSTAEHVAASLRWASQTQTGRTQPWVVLGGDRG